MLIAEHFVWNLNRQESRSGNFGRIRIQNHFNIYSNILYLVFKDKVCHFLGTDPKPVNLNPDPKSWSFIPVIQTFMTYTSHAYRRAFRLESK